MEKIVGTESLVGLAAFVRVAGAGGYSAAARGLGVSPSAVSKSVRRLEASLGVVLFNRTTRSLSLTPEGRDLHERCVGLLAEMESIRTIASAARGSPSGRLVIAAPLALGRLVVAPQLARLRALHPALEPELSLSDRYADLIRDGVDVALRIGVPADSRLVGRRLTPHRLVVCAAPDYLARRGVPQRPDDLLGHDCVNFRLATTGRLFRWPFQVAGEVIQIEPRGVLTVDDGEALATVAVSGVGIACIASYIAAPYVGTGRLVPLLTTFAADGPPISVLYAAARRTSPAVRAFVAFATELIPSRPSWDEVCDEPAGEGSG